VLLKPRFEPQTLLLWGIPPLSLLGGLVVLLVMARRRQTTDLSAGELSATEQQRIAKLVKAKSE